MSVASTPSAATGVGARIGDASAIGAIITEARASAARNVVFFIVEGSASVSRHVRPWPQASRLGRPVPRAIHGRDLGGKACDMMHEIAIVVIYATAPTHALPCLRRPLRTAHPR